MTKLNLKNILTAVRDIINRSRIAYKDYLGEETVTETKALVDGTLSEQGTLTLKDPSFTGFVVGEGYEVTIDDTTQTLIAILDSGVGVITNAIDLNNPGENYFIVGFLDNQVKGEAGGTYIGKTISISQTKTTTTKKYDIKKVPQELIPDTIARSVDVAKVETKAHDAFNKADAAQIAADNAQAAANNAQTAADNAQTAADNAQTAADNAQTAADNAQTAADNAQTTAENALARVVEPYTGNLQMAPLYKNGGFSAWRDVVQSISYNTTEGYFYVNELNTTALKGEDIPRDVFCVNVYLGSQLATAFLSHFVTTNDFWSVSGFAVITSDDSRVGELLYVSANTISKNEAKGLFLTFRAPNSMLLKSSTANSDKQFRITVDDTGTLSATEVTA